MVAASPRASAARPSALRPPAGPAGAPVVEPDLVELTGRSVVVHELVETDAEVLRVVRDADDPTAAVQQCLRVGARAVLAANVSVETHIVEKRFDAMTDRFDEQVEAAVVRIASATEALLDEHDGALPQVLEGHRADLDRLLGDAFDPDSKVSVIALFEQVLADAHEHQVHAVSRLVSTDGDESPLARLRLDVVRDLKEHVGEVRKDVAALSEKVAVTEAVAPVLELTSGKGFRFEDVVDGCVSALASAHGDVAERVGTETGVTGTQKGDELVTLNLDDTQGHDARFVLEAKARKLTMRSTLKELDDALENREALAAIAVFARQEQAPTSVPFHYSGNKAVVVLDAEGLEDAPLRLAYMWARWVVRRELAGTAADALDCARISTLIDDAARAVDRCSTIRKYHTQVRRGIERASGELDALADEVRDALAGIAEELAADDADAQDV